MASDQDNKNNENIENEFSEDSGESRIRLAEAFKKVISVGIGAAFMTEENIRSYLSELKLPKEALNLVIQSANKSKEELFNKVGNELTKILSKVDIVKEASRFVEEHKFKINAEIEVVKKGDNKAAD